MDTITGATCGAACWHALEDICRCSCGGRNHAILRTEAGTQPIRTRKLDGGVYEMHAVEVLPQSDECRAQTKRPLELLVDMMPGVILKTATRGEVARWPELAGWQGDIDQPLIAWLRRDA